MDQTAIVNKIKDNALNIAIIFLAIIIAFKMTQKNEADLVFLKERAKSEASKSQLLIELGTLENKLITLKGKINNKAIDSIIHKIGGFATDAKVKLINIRPMEERKFGIYSRFPFELQLASDSYHGIGRFINILERSSDIYFIESLSITPSTAAEDKVGSRIVLYTILINDKQ